MRLVIKGTLVGGLCIVASLVVLFMVEWPSTDTTSPTTATGDIDHPWREGSRSRLRVQTPVLSPDAIPLDFAGEWRVSIGSGLRLRVATIVDRPLALDFGDTR